MMKKLTTYLLLLFVTTTLFSGFKNSEQKQINSNPTEFELLVQYLEENGNFINSELAPTLITANEVKKNLKNVKYHIIDIRSESWFEYGHLKNAHNVKASELLTYFENKINASDYNKIILICYSGQSAAYYTSLLRLAGYNNTYSMKWGMSSWREDFAENSWKKNIANTFANKLETTKNTKAKKGIYPTLNTGKTNAKEILKIRLKKAFEIPYREHIIKSTEVFQNPSSYYIINYWNQERYNNGHIPGAIQYQPNSSLASNTFLYTLPTNKEIAMYCSTGQNAAYAVAYLNLIGYKTSNIAYGANSFMNKILKEKNWNAFSKKEINMYPVIE
ncbi:rhodanese-like domain-containing protein [Lutibacter sp.]|uniref:rhodanese-like domain-containing protein n=1 Tax=Lutibacter sp. TaxID=1925666 RepID=UPI0025C082BF|nr:rhodanese-like domain-containing protein [Lutibacter sp.]MCF6167749.1 rhodanese-like domain-containing protein [Lutibacter sp.]